MRISAWLVSLAVVGAWSASASAQCTRHFYNNSNVPWTVSMASIGLCNGLPFCTVAPRTTSSLVYFPFPIGGMVIGSPFYDQAFAVSGCKIHHSGNTGAIAVNDPADGDVNTCGRSWRCPGQIRRRLR